jgi:hypothetical protein
MKHELMMKYHLLSGKTKQILLQNLSVSFLRSFKQDLLKILVKRFRSMYRM